MIILCSAVSAEAQASCLPKGELEKVYCQLQAKGEALPALRDFRRNSPRMQRLLLTRSATRHNIALPVLASAAPKLAPVAKPAVKKENIRRALKPIVKPKDQYLLKEPAYLTPSIVLKDSCSLSGGQIICPNARYSLLDNLNNRHLDTDVFSANNRLGLSNYRGQLNQSAELKRYMANTYQQYIEGMLKIGLAASTMTYSRFYYTFEDAWNNKRDFADRFEKMYVFLKRDKQTMGVKKRYSSELPQGLHQCAELSAELIVCDNQKINWVYRRI